MKILANDGIAPEGKKRLEEAGFIVVTDTVPQEELPEAINRNNYEILLVRSATTVRRDIIDSCPGLKLIGRGGVGVDNIDVEDAKAKNIKVINTPAASSQSVAELVFAHLFGLIRYLHDSNCQMPEHGVTDFKKLKKKYSGGIELKGKTLGIIGLGRIGRAVAGYALGCGMKVIAHDSSTERAQICLDIYRTGEIKIVIPSTSLDEVLGNSDFITLHVPGSNNGNQLISASEINKMRDGAIIINTARGGVVDEDALLQALDSGKLAGAGLDVFENEPNPSEAILKHPKISLTPHIGAATVEAQKRIGLELADKIIARFK